MITKPDRDRHSAVDGRWVVGLIIVALPAPLIWFFVGMPGMDHSSDRTLDGMSEMEIAVTTARDVPCDQGMGRSVRRSGCEADQFAAS